MEYFAESAEDVVAAMGRGVTRIFAFGICIDDTEAIALANALETNTTLTHLRFERNNIGNAGAGALAQSLQTNSTLTHLKIGKSQVDDEGARALATALGNNSALKVLDLEGNDIGNDGAADLALVLETNSTLSTLDLHHNKICDGGACALARALRRNATLTALFLDCNPIGSDGIEALLEVLESNSTLTRLDVGRMEGDTLGAWPLPDSAHEEEHLEQERLEQEHLEQVRVEQERVEQERLEQERVETANHVPEPTVQVQQAFEGPDSTRFCSTTAMENFFDSIRESHRLSCLLASQGERAQSGVAFLDDASAVLDQFVASADPIARMADLDSALASASVSAEALDALQTILRNPDTQDRAQTAERRDAVRRDLLSSLRVSLAFPFERSLQDIEVDAADTHARVLAAIEALGPFPPPAPSDEASSVFGSAQAVAQEALHHIASWKSRHDLSRLRNATEAAIEGQDEPLPSLKSLLKGQDKLDGLEGWLTGVRETIRQEIAALENRNTQADAPLCLVRAALATISVYYGSVLPGQVQVLRDRREAAKIKLNDVAAGENEPSFSRIESCVAELRSASLGLRETRHRLQIQLQDLEEDLAYITSLDERANAVAEIADIQRQLDELDAASTRRRVEHELLRERARILNIAMKHFPEKRFDEGFMLRLRVNAGLPVAELCRSGVWLDGARQSDFFVQETLAAAGSKTVVRATDPRGAVVVLKRFFLGDEDRQRHFYRQCGVLQALRNSFVVCVQGVFVEGHFGFLVTPFYDRGSLDKWLLTDVGQARSVEVCKSIACDVLDGLVAMHAAGCVHMDVKPGNVLLTQSGRAVIGDFDGVRQVDATATRALHVTLKYLAPEVASGAATAARSSADMYAFGKVLAELFGGIHDVAALVDELCSEDPTARPSAAQVRRRAFFDRAAVEVRDCMACMDKVDRARAACCPQGHAVCQESCLEGFLGALQDERLAPDGSVSCRICDELIPSSELARLAPPAVWAAVQARLQDQHRADLEREFKALLEAELAKGEMELGLRRHWNHITGRILSLSCPRCGEVFADFDRCFAISCGRNGCGCHFCAWCLQDCGDDAHRHVRDCPQNREPHQGLFGDRDVLARAWAELRGERLARYWRSDVARESAELQHSLRERIAPLLDGVVPVGFQLPEVARP